MHESLTIQIGQCGNQVGNEFWKRISAEHGISYDEPELSQYRGRRDRFFYTTDSGRDIPRAILLDSEPRVINQSPDIFNMDSIFITADGGGAGNNWAQGFALASKIRDEITEMIQREAEACDSLESFNILHSVAGGTGSGFGSMILSEIKDAFPKSIINAFAILPNTEEGSEVVVQPYNTVLAINFLNQFCNCVIPMDNHALSRIALDSTRIKNISYNLINMLVSTVISTATSTIRFPSYIYCDAYSINSCVVPLPEFKFVIPSYTPFNCESISRLARKSNVNDTLRKLGMPQTRLCSYSTSKTYSDISRFNILEGVKDLREVARTTAILQNRWAFNPVRWIPPFIQTVLTKRETEYGRVGGLCLANTTGIAAVLSKIGSQFDQLKKRNAFVEIYRKYDVTLEDFDRSRENLQSIIESYEMCEVRAPAGNL